MSQTQVEPAAQALPLAVALEAVGFQDGPDVRFEMNGTGGLSGAE
jgi:hypothetical protein